MFLFRDAVGCSCRSYCSVNSLYKKPLGGSEECNWFKPIYIKMGRNLISCKILNKFLNMSNNKHILTVMR